IANNPPHKQQIKKLKSKMQKKIQPIKQMTKLNKIHIKKLLKLSNKQIITKKPHKHRLLQMSQTHNKQTSLKKQRHTLHHLQKKSEKKNVKDFSYASLIYKLKMIPKPKSLWLKKRQFLLKSYRN